MTTTKIVMKAHPIDNETYAFECSECGPIGTESILLINVACFEHLKDWHGAHKVEWKMGDDPWPDEGPYEEPHEQPGEQSGESG